jgi:two-component system CheB/CheR fusion protein
VVITFTDVTASRTLEAKLRESLALYQAPFEKIGEGVIFQASGGEITLVNTAAERILGMPRDLMQKCSSTDPLSQAVHEDGSPFSPEDSPAMVALATGRPVENVVMGVLNPSSQRRVWISVSATPVVLPGKERPSHVCMIFRDDTENLAPMGPTQPLRRAPAS